MEAFRGLCKFQQYIPNKPAKYRIKIYALVDARMFYTVNLEIYPGLHPEGPYKVDNDARSVVMHVVAPILNTGEISQSTTLVPLAKILLEQKTILVGSLRKNKKEVPP
ncbi:hypothetical protein PR048_008599 [Dryococelus australis]|uniref:PiggyBac transposable element-derived protein domain-containing protein n=1 Tax=Dryococelus australis TaxID=614101 RepID=A0ABQ9HYI4_9NEOP|nr:hypothetical protein PR048_008599 [Dryococelus australis]